jgi:hypothetical protein
MNSKSLNEAFFAGVRSASMPYCVNDLVEVVAGAHSGVRGWTVLIDIRGVVVRFLVEFVDGTDELFLASDLTLIATADA